MSISTYVRNCNIVKSGVNPRIFVAPKGAISSATFADEKLTAITLSGANFSELQADFQSVSFTSEQTTSRISSHEATLTARFSHASSNFTKLLEELKSKMNCGLVAVFQLATGGFFISGIDPVDREGGSVPFRTLTANYNSGEGVQDEEGDQWTLELSKESAEVEMYEIDETLAADIKNGTATWIDFA